MSIFGQMNHWLEGKPDQTLSWMLVGLAILGVGLAVWAPPAVKAFVLAYWLLP